MNSKIHKFGFIYNLNMANEIPNFDCMPSHIQSSVEYNALQVIYESFIVTGDQDYLMSRFLSQNGFPRGFYWAAAQAVEKYLKAFLLMNGESVKNFRGHPIKELFKLSCNIDSSIGGINVLPHRNINVDASISNVLKELDIIRFIDDIERFGSADNRYNTYGVEYETAYLFAMDSFSYNLRRKICTIKIEVSFKRLSTHLIEMFYKINPWFQKEENQLVYQVPSNGFPIIRSYNITHFQLLLNNRDSSSHRIALRWLRDKMKLPKS